MYAERVPLVSWNCPFDLGQGGVGSSYSQRRSYEIQGKAPLLLASMMSLIRCDVRQGLVDYRGTKALLGYVLIITIQTFVS